MRTFILCPFGLFHDFYSFKSQQWHKRIFAFLDRNKLLPSSKESLIFSFRIGGQNSTLISAEFNSKSIQLQARVNLLLKKWIKSNSTKSEFKSHSTASDGKNINWLDGQFYKRNLTIENKQNQFLRFILCFAASSLLHYTVIPQEIREHISLNWFHSAFFNCLNCHCL